MKHLWYLVRGLGILMCVAIVFGLIILAALGFIALFNAHPEAVTLTIVAIVLVVVSYFIGKPV